ncbi:A24 family peptidase [Catenulispora subtropica]|uniref:Prepilin type IV endopeptidase peptidase domain-containing protein n=1 Tax=Catenulispora subtropica TaxID=450798 RepID=A0ABN2RVF4_9ACTN
MSEIREDVVELIGNGSEPAAGGEHAATLDGEGGEGSEGISGGSEAAEAAEAEVRPWQPVVGRWRVLIAVGTVLLEAGVVVRLGPHWSTLPVVAFAATAVALAVIDFAILRLPNALTAPTAAAVVGALIAEALAEHHPHRLLSEAEGGLALGLFYMLLYALSRGGLGLGDVKLGAVAGMLLASRDWVHVFNGTFLAYVITLVIALAMLRRGKKRFPYGPGLIAGAIIVLLVG